MCVVVTIADALLCFGLYLLLLLFFLLWLFVVAVAVVAVLVALSWLLKDYCLEGGMGFLGKTIMLNLMSLLALIGVYMF